MNRTSFAAIWPPNGAAARAAGHERMSPLQAIRRKCLDCTGHQPAEVRHCEAVTCTLWPFRAGRHPYTTKALQEASSGRRTSGGSHVPDRPASSTIALQQADLGAGAKDAGQPSPPRRNSELDIVTKEKESGAASASLPQCVGMGGGAS